MSKRKLFIGILSGLIILTFCVIPSIISAYGCDNPSEEQSIRNRCNTFCKNKGDVAECTIYTDYGDCAGNCVCNNGAYKEINPIGGGGGGGGCKPPYCQQN